MPPDGCCPNCPFRPLLVVEEPARSSKYIVITAGAACGRCNNANIVVRFFEFGSRLQCLLAPLYSKCWLTTSCFSTTTILLCFCSGIKKKLMPEGRWCQINVRRVQLYFYYLAKLGRRTHARNDLNINLLDFILSRDRFICACISFDFFFDFLVQAMTASTVLCNMISL